jgi:hypothetical protein
MVQTNTEACPAALKNSHPVQQPSTFSRNPQTSNVITESEKETFESDALAAAHKINLARRQQKVKSMTSAVPSNPLS